MTPRDELDAVLTELGYPGGPIPEHERSYFEDEFVLFGPLFVRGWLLRFDGEGDFFQPGAHSRVIRDLLRIAGVDPLPTVQDRWAKGWLFEIHDEGRYVGHHWPSEEAEPSDFVEGLLVASVVDAWLPGHVLLDLNTGDQTACFCLAPRRVFERLVAAGFVDLEREEAFYPQEDELVLPPGEDLDAFDEEVVKLVDRGQAAALV